VNHSLFIPHPFFLIFLLFLWEIGTGFSDEGAVALALALETPAACRFLENLNIGRKFIACFLHAVQPSSDCNIGDVGLAALLRAFQEPGACPALRELSVNGGVPYSEF
jgi:hypothetical protein